ncbi:MAG: VanZ family protein [Desulfamplus sp.]|nr:VanZ family protein [Desulfamplus sp.]
MLAVLLCAMPWAALSPAASPPSQWAGVMHMAAMAVFAILACTGFVSLRGRTVVVLFVFGFSAVMEGLQHFSPHRTGSWEDVGFNAAGCLAGVLLFAVIHGGRVALVHFWRPVRISEGK